MRAELDRALSRTWSRQDYLDAYAAQHVASKWSQLQKWSGAAATGDVVAFNTLLLPNDPGTSAADLAGEVSVLLADADATAIRLGPDLVVVNPAGKMLSVTPLQTDFRYLLVKDIEGESPYIAGLGGRLLKWGEKTLHESQSVSDVER